MARSSPRTDRTLASGRSPALALAKASMLLFLTAALVVTGLFVLQRPRDIEAAPAERIAVPADLETVTASLEGELSRLRAANRRLKSRIASYHPKGLHLVIDTGANILYLMKGDRILREAICSTGSGMSLSDPNNPRSWVFDTPRGEFHIRRKEKGPVWTKPDWAFIEEGEDLPSNWRDRIEKGVLGEYSMDLGDGYLIHGTLFERSLGLHVTHGCVRLGAEDLEAIFRSVRIGTKVYII